MQRDIQAFLSHPKKRLEDVEINERGFEDWTYNYNEDPRSLAGLRIDFASWKVSFPVYRRLEPNAQLLEFNCVPFVEEMLYNPLGLYNPPNRSSR